MHNSSPSYTVKEALAKLMKFCVYRERCHQEVQDKLNKLQMIPEAQEQIIIKLLEDDFLNEERFAKAFVRDKFRFQHWGKYRLKRELKQRNISDYLIKKSLNQIDSQAYRESLEQLLEKRLRSIHDTHPLKIKRKVVNHLLRKGYEADLIYAILREKGL